MNKSEAKKLISEFADIVGEDVEKATQRVKATGNRLRVVKRDGVSLMLTMDARSDRINVHTVQGKVTLIDGVY